MSWWFILPHSEGGGGRGGVKSDQWGIKATDASRSEAEQTESQEGHSLVLGSFMNEGPIWGRVQSHLVFPEGVGPQGVEHGVVDRDEQTG
ncbi:hypothetical protein NHX12_013325 [Muraenolepis orangiensis]|uniref:Uncharacterized protein n=1 Tax=Muraenolepis orangiensis TaxID=630683 RepID=A0A9Q0DEH6_9TELE|nr:hypothetical protein NHX12_013325 [Muraenolepis orangiensis]